MAIVLNRTTKKLIKSANTPDFSVADWIINPDLSAITGFDSKYWTITGDNVTLKSLTDRNAIDVAEAAVQLTNEKNRIDTDAILKAFALLVLDEINILRRAASLSPRTQTQLINAIKNKVT